MRISSIFCVFTKSKLSIALMAIMLFTLFGLSTPALAEDWPMFLKDPSHSGAVAKSPSTSLKLKWKFETAGPIYSSAIVSGNTVFIASYDKFLYALNSTTGELKWKFETKGEILSTPVVSKGVVYVGSKDGNLYALSASSGELEWKHKADGSILTSLVLGMGYVFFGASDTYVYAIDIEDGERVWRSKLKENTKYGGIYSSPAYKDGALFIAGKNRILNSYDAETGARNWAAPTKSAIYSSPVLSGDVIYLASFDRKIYAYDIESGKPIFRRSIKEFAYSTPAIHDDSIYLGLKNGEILVLDLYSGKKMSSFKLPGAINSSIVVDSNGVLYVGCADGHIYLLDSSGTVLSKYKTGAGVHSTPAISGGRLYVGSKDGSLYAFE